MAVCPARMEPSGHEETNKPKSQIEKLSMELQHINVKMFVEGELSADLENFINVFHRLVADQAVDEMMIDVADYRHVPAGPGVVMVGLEADYAIDHKDNRYGLRYNRKGPLEGTNQERLLDAVRKTVKACELLENEIDGVTFSRTNLELFVNDRALAPNTSQTLSACRPIFESFLRDDLGQEKFELDFESDPRKLFGARLQLGQPLQVPSNV